MKKQRVSITLPQIKTTVNGMNSFSNDWSGEVRGAPDIRRAIQDQLEKVIIGFRTQLEDNLSAKVTFEDGSSLEVPVGVELWPSFTPQITAASVNLHEGGEVPMRFGGTLHRILFTASRGGYIRHTKSHITLQELELVNKYGQITVKGTEVLTELFTLGPSDNKKGILRTLGVLLNPRYVSADNVTFAYLKQAGFLDQRIVQGAVNIEATDKGVNWITERAERVLRYKNLDYEIELGIIKYLPVKLLNKCLASSDKVIREAAQKRMKKLQPVEKVTTTTGRAEPFQVLCYKDSNGKLKVWQGNQWLDQWLEKQQKNSGG